MKIRKMSVGELIPPPAPNPQGLFGQPNLFMITGTFTLQDMIATYPMEYPMGARLANPLHKVVELMDYDYPRRYVPCR